jgi:acyl-coenzyme A synthetase/AMP-(fatty) acid ligase
MRHLPFTQDEGIAVIAERAAARLPDGIVNMATPSSILGLTDSVVDYAQLAGLVDSAAGWVAAAGVAPGQRVAIVKGNHLDIFVLGAGASRAGAVPALLSQTMAPAQAQTVLARIDPAVIFIEQSTASAWGLDSCGPWRLVILDGTRPGAIGLDELRGAPTVGCRPPAYEDLMVITHTSGTTGVPKLVAHSARTISERARVATLPIPIGSIRRRDRYAACIAWNHARAVDGMIAWLHVGCPLLALNDPSPAVVAPQLQAFRPTIIEAVANHYLLWEGLARKRPSLFADTRMFANAFDAIHPRSVRIMLDASHRRLPLWFQGYGQSEVGCATVDVYSRRSVRRRPGGPLSLRSVGWTPLGLTKVRVADRDSGVKLPSGQVGEIEVRSSAIALNYVGQEALHAQQRHGDWWRTGDVGWRTRSGRIVLHDRIVDMVPGVGSCLELEDALLDALPEATEVAVLNVEGVPVPIVCTYEDRPLAPESWERATRVLKVDLAPPIHMPWDQVPRTATYKIRRLALAQSVAATTAVADRQLTGISS